MLEDLATDQNMQTEQDPEFLPLSWKPVDETEKSDEIESKLKL